ncbi:hypothetical protein [Thalassobacillus sp. CUG 92003]|uniref:hypothetical protein n=1 Tax=Thalassobacillus sp. CUG 92003 TaxID=2736641 RepID=UPI0015E69941|nr:hypothetical protein [Thalassobacillus sp. CUG 92003]
MPHTTYCCQDCQQLEHMLKQQERVIVQLVEIVAATNRRVNELDKCQTGVEHHMIVREQCSRFVSSVPSYTSPVNE